MIDQLKDNPPHRRLPYAGIVGNGRTCALVDDRGRIAWLCIPTFAQFPVFASVLDPVHGGCLELGLKLNDQVLWFGDYGHFQQRYLPATNILETASALAGFQITIHDVMPWGQAALVRDVTIEPVENSTGCPTLMVRLRATSPTPLSTHFQPERDGMLISETRCPARGHLVCRAERGEQLSVHLDERQLTFEFMPHECRLTLLVAYKDDQAPSPHAHSTVHPVSDETWLSEAVRLTLPDKQLESAFERSLLVLRLLTYEPTGAILAAATASLPSKPGGTHNWDYRYCWVRDACYTAQALAQVGQFEPARRLYEFLLDREVDGQWLSPLWAIEPDYPTTEEEVIGLYGPGGESPVRIGNGAAMQDQHDSPGNMLTGVYQYCALTGTTDLAMRYWPNLARAVEWSCDHWAEAEAGIWEKRDRNRPWVHGRAMCWVAIRDGIRLAQLLGKSAPPRWEMTTAQISRELLDAAWSEEKGAVLRACESPSIYDVSVLALLLERLVGPDEPHMKRTVETLARAMAYGPAFRRDEDDVRYPFGLATLWMTRALLLMGEHERAYTHLQAVIESATNLDLMAEYFDPISGRQWGNLPQAFSHEELIKTVAGMLWHWDGEQLALFPHIPSAWLAPGNVVQAENIPLNGKRVSISLVVEQGCLHFAVHGATGIMVIVPERYRGQTIELDRAR